MFTTSQLPPPLRAFEAAAALVNSGRPDRRRPPDAEPEPQECPQSHDCEGQPVGPVQLAVACLVWLAVLWLLGVLKS